TTFDAGLRPLAPRGVLVLYGQSGRPVPPFDPQRLAAGGSLVLTRPTLGHLTRPRDVVLGRARELFGRIAELALSVRLGATRPRAEAAAAPRALASRATTGQVLLLP